MIFKSKKAFDEEVYKRMNEIDFQGRTNDKLYRLEEEVNNLKYRISRLEDRFTTPQQQPYIVNPSWTGANPVDHTPYTAWGGNSTTGGDSSCTT